MEAREKNLCSILPEDINLPWILRLAQEGRLYYDANGISKETVLADLLQQVLNYVEAITPCASSAYKSSITDIWTRIVRDKNLNENLFLKKGRNAGFLNHYYITAIVSVMLECNVYNKKMFTLFDLHCRLEKVGKKTSIYTSYNNYALGIEKIKYLRQYWR